jgi:hypothetical protein
MPPSALSVCAFAFALAGVGHAADTQMIGSRTPEKPAATATYRSVFDSYRRFSDEPVAPWRQVNDEVARVGGHAGALKSDRGSQPPASAAPANGTPSILPAHP